MKVIEEAEIGDYIESLSDALDEPDQEVAKATFWQLFDFDFERVVVLDGDVTLKKGESLFSAEWLEQQGIVADVGRLKKKIVVVEGNVVTADSINLTENYCIIKGDLKCDSLYVDGDALFVCFGKVTAKYIWSSYNGVQSGIKKAQTDYVVLSSDEMLRIFEAETDLICLDEGLRALVKHDLLIDEVVADENPLNAFLRTVEAGENPYKNDITVESVKTMLSKEGLVPKGERVHLAE